MNPGLVSRRLPTVSLKAQQAIKDFQKQLDILRASEAEQPIVKINQAFADFRRRKARPPGGYGTTGQPNDWVDSCRAGRASGQLDAMRAKLAEMAGPLKALDEAGVFFARTSRRSTCRRSSTS